MASLLSKLCGRLVEIREALTRKNAGRMDRGLFPYHNPGMPTAQVAVTEHSALTISAVFAACRAISEDIARLDLNLYRREPDGSQTLVRDHPLYYLLDIKPNSECDSFNFIQAIIACAMLWGNGYAEIERDQRGRPIALWLLDPRDMQLQRDALNTLHYVWQGSTRLDLSSVNSGAMDSGAFAIHFTVEGECPTGVADVEQFAQQYGPVREGESPGYPRPDVEPFIKPSNPAVTEPFTANDIDVEQVERETGDPACGCNESKPYQTRSLAAAHVQSVLDDDETRVAA